VLSDGTLYLSVVAAMLVFHTASIREKSDKILLNEQFYKLHEALRNS
jgi:hypothetical protein